MMLLYLSLYELDSYHQVYFQILCQKGEIGKIGKIGKIEEIKEIEEIGEIGEIVSCCILGVD